MASQHRKLGKLVQKLYKQGWTTRYGNGHLVLYPADKSQHPVVCAVTSVSTAGERNFIAALRRAGAII